MLVSSPGFYRPAKNMFHKSVSFVGNMRFHRATIGNLNTDGESVTPVRQRDVIDYLHLLAKKVAVPLRIRCS